MGTSAAALFVAGIIALVLEAKYLCGCVHVQMHVNCAQHWINVPEQKSCTFSPSTNNGWVV